MRQELEISQSHEGGLNHFSMNSGEGCRVMSHAEEVITGPSEQLNIRKN